VRSLYNAWKVDSDFSRHFGSHKVPSHKGVLLAFSGQMCFLNDTISFSVHPVAYISIGEISKSFTTAEIFNLTLTLRRLFRCVYRRFGRSNMAHTAYEFPGASWVELECGSLHTSQSQLQGNSFNKVFMKFVTSNCCTNSHCALYNCRLRPVIFLCPRH
jgi:hypothetical protein